MIILQRAETAFREASTQFCRTPLEAKPLIDVHRRLKTFFDISQNLLRQNPNPFAEFCTI
jgi:hypothetical protein